MIFLSNSSKPLSHVLVDISESPRMDLRVFDMKLTSSHLRKRRDLYCIYLKLKFNKHARMFLFTLFGSTTEFVFDTCLPTYVCSETTLNS